MKKFIAPEVRVVRYDTSILCASVSVGGDVNGDDVEFDAPGRRRGIFDDGESATTSGRL
ncbi:MAG: hypothetical protein IJS92_07240 [Paludibacteraceae bacterium]|nr:hypothetical protein [Paludibacteraceae bacterium]